MITQHFYLESWSSIVEVVILNVRWYNIDVHSLNGIQTVSSKENCSSPVRFRVRVRVSFTVAEGNFPWGQLSQNLFEYTKNRWKNTLDYIYILSNF